QCKHHEHCAKQPLHQARRLGDEAHEEEQRHRGEHLLLHQPDGLEVGQVEHHLAQGKVAEAQREEQQREGDLDADENRTDHDDQHDQPDQDLGGHISIFSLCSSSMPVRQAYALLIVSDTPWNISSTQVRGTTPLYGQRIGRHGVRSDVWLMVNEYQASLPLAASSMMSDGTKKRMYEIESTMPLVLADHASSK